MQTQMPHPDVQYAYPATLHGLSDERLQYQVTDRLSFMRFWELNWLDVRTEWAWGGAQGCGASKNV